MDVPHAGHAAFLSLKNRAVLVLLHQIGRNLYRIWNLTDLVQYVFRHIRLGSFFQNREFRR